MNILGDFITRVNNLYPLEIENDELNSLLTTIKNQGDELAIRDKEIAKLKNLIGRLEKQTGAASTETDAPATKATPTRKAASTTKKSTTKKTASAAKKSTAKKPASTTKKAASSTTKKPASSETK